MLKKDDKMKKKRKKKIGASAKAKAKKMAQAQAQNIKIYMGDAKRSSQQPRTTITKTYATYTPPRPREHQYISQMKTSPQILNQLEALRVENQQLKEREAIKKGRQREYGKRHYQKVKENKRILKAYEESRGESVEDKERREERHRSLRRLRRNPWEGTNDDGDDDIYDEQDEYGGRGTNDDGGDDIYDEQDEYGGRGTKQETKQKTIKRKKRATEEGSFPGKGYRLTGRGVGSENDDDGDDIFQ